MPALARKHLVRSGEIAVYHVWSRCVQRAFLCGYDPVTGCDFNYRRRWIESLLKHLAGVFAVDVGNFNVLQNHQHLILRTRPDIAAQWSDEEVAWRWKRAWPWLKDGEWVAQPNDEDVEELLKDPDRLAKARANLSCLSWFLARWKEPIAKLCNQETNRRGHFYEGRFGCRELVDENEVFCCSLYVDLNQVKAGAAESLETSNHAAIQNRILAWKRREAAASLAEIRSDPNEKEIGEDEQAGVKTLFDDVWLAPIGTPDPELQVHQEPTADTELTASEPTGVNPGDGDQVEPNSSETPAGTAPTRATRSHDRHNRLLAMLRKRKRRRRCILSIPWPQYLASARQAVRRLKGERATKKQKSDQPSDWPMSPSQWSSDVAAFTRWLAGKARGKPKSLSRNQLPRGDPS